ncbi:unnamed protein product [Protopolystoma xenopodis]|uniref:Uncharacterized protein n=1 Tax=Protopolystoma xenopodis TaxID=117903 RepID=A0A448WCR7_9PLAT|nr:unnamed protein product [Protopolystoma xenopodis]
MTSFYPLDRAIGATYLDTPFPKPSAIEVSIIPSARSWTWYIRKLFSGIVSESCHSQHQTTTHQRQWGLTFLRNCCAITPPSTPYPLVSLLSIATSDLFIFQSSRGEFTVASSHLLSAPSSGSSDSSLVSGSASWASRSISYLSGCPISLSSRPNVRFTSGASSKAFCSMYNVAPAEERLCSDSHS